MKIKPSKKIIILVIAILILLGIGKILKVKGYIQKGLLYQSLVKLHILKQCYKAHSDLLEIMAQEGFDYEKLNEKAVLLSLDKLTSKNIQAHDKLKIPAITHRVYFVVENSPPILNDFYIEEMKVNFNKLNNLGGSWQHNIWTNKIDIIPDEVKNIKGVQIRSPEELKDSSLYETLLEIIAQGQIKKPHLAEAADLIRLMAVQKFGGIYMDMDYEIYNPKALFDLMGRFDFIAGREKFSQHSLYGNAFIAAKPGHPIINESLRRALKNRVDNSLDYIKYPCSGYDQLYFNGPPLLTISYFSKNNIEGNNDVILPPWMIFNIAFARFKNGIYYNHHEYHLDSISKVKEFFKIGSDKRSDMVCNYSIVTKEDFNLNNDKLDQLLADFSQNISMEDLEKYYQLKNASGRKDSGYRDYEKNIYYNLQARENFPIIGADMFCGSWTSGGKIFKKNYYWNFDSNNYNKVKK